jgi:hypothetical protein
MDKIEFENRSVIESIENAGVNTRSKRGQEQLDKISPRVEEIDEEYCYNWYKDMYMRQGCSDEVASKRAKIDLNYQISLFDMCKVFGVKESDFND